MRQGTTNVDEARRRERGTARRFAGFVSIGAVPTPGGKPPCVSQGYDSRLVERGAAGHMTEVAPVECAGGRLRVCINGRLDNAAELVTELGKRNRAILGCDDAEIIAHAYQQWGEAFVERLRGAFAIAVWDEEAGTVLLARDRIGVKPMFYSKVGNGLAFASQLDALREVATISDEIDPKAIDAYLVFRAVPAPLSIYQSVQKLPSGHVLKYANGAITLGRYWSLDFKRATCVDAVAAAETLYALMHQVIRDIDVDRSTLLLSSGLDSAILLSELSKSAGSAVETVSFACTGGFNELQGAQRTARHFGANHEPIFVQPDVSEAMLELARGYEEPLGNASALFWYYQCRVLREHAGPVVSGEGADDVFAGRDRHLAVRFADRLHSIADHRLLSKLAWAGSVRRVGFGLETFLNGAALPPVERYLAWTSTFSPADRARLYSDDFAKHLAEDSAPELLAPLIHADSHPLDQMLSADLGIWVSEVLCATLRTDDIDLRLPFLDHRMFEFAATIVPSMRAGWTTSKRFLRRAYSARVPTWVRHSRRKGGMKLPVGPRLRHELRPLLEDYLLSPSALGHQYFKSTELRRLVNEHVEGTADHGSQLWALLMLELWYRHRHKTSDRVD